MAWKKEIQEDSANDAARHIVNNWQQLGAHDACDQRRWFGIPPATLPSPVHPLFSSDCYHLLDLFLLSIAFLRLLVHPPVRFYAPQPRRRKPPSDKKLLEKKEKKILRKLSKEEEKRTTDSFYRAHDEQTASSSSTSPSSSTGAEKREGRGGRQARLADSKEDLARQARKLARKSLDRGNKRKEDIPQVPAVLIVSSSSSSPGVCSCLIRHTHTRASDKSLAAVRERGG
jgi:hypothetical protein